MGELTALPQTDLLAGLWGPTSKGRKGERRGGEVRGGTLDPHNVGDRLTFLLLEEASSFFVL